MSNSAAADGDLSLDEMMIAAIEILESWPDSYAPGRDSTAVEAMEMRRIIIAMLASRKYVQWSSSYNFPNPETVGPEYRLSQDWHMWPQAPDDGRAQGILFQQANIVADLLFDQLKLEHGVPQAQDNPREPEVGRQMEGIEENAPAKTQLPNAKNTKPQFRLTTDWVGWPSLGVTHNQTTDASAARFSLMADSIFQTIKAITIARRKNIPAKGKVKPAAEDVQDLIEGEETELADLYATWIAKGHTVYVQRGGKAAAKDAKLFREWLAAQDGISTEAMDTVNDLDEKEMADKYTSLGKKWKAKEKAKSKPDDERQTKNQGKKRARKDDDDGEGFSGDNEGATVPSKRRLRGRRTSVALDTEALGVEDDHEEMEEAEVEAEAGGIAGNDNEEHDEDLYADLYDE